MPALIKRLTSRGLVDVDYAADSLSQAAQYEARAGVYTVSNTLNHTQTLLFDAHLERLEDSARREGIPLRYDRKQLRSALREMILAAGYGDVRFRISVCAASPADMLLSIEPYAPPAESLLRLGARCNTSSLLARQNPAAKSNDWMHRRKTLESDRPAHIVETFLVNARGEILEGLGSNFYALIRGELRTAGKGVLAGISRQIVYAVSADMLPLRLDAPRMDELPIISEAFFSSSSRGIIPVVEIDGVAIGKGAPGETTGQLRAAYQRWVAANLAEL